MEAMETDETDLREQIFHNNVREQIIFLLLFILLYITSYIIIEKFIKKEEVPINEEEEFKVYRISLWLCTFALAVSIMSALLLPISIVSNEVLTLYPNSYYVQWLNSSLIQGLWNYVFLFSNLSLFVLLPFAYLFSESAGFIGTRSGIRSRVYETFTVFFLLIIVTLGFAFVISSVIEAGHGSVQKMLSLWSYLPFLYSCVSFVGVILLLVFTPLGFVRLFGVVGQVLVKPQFLRDLNKEYYVYTFEENAAKSRLENATRTGKVYISQQPFCPTPLLYEETPSVTPILRRRNGALQSGLEEALCDITKKRQEIEKQRATSSLRRNFVYPAAMLLLLSLTLCTVFMVAQNTLELLIGIKALPLSTRQFTLGIASLSKLGWTGACLEALVIVYLGAASLTGVSTLSPVRKRLPRPNATGLQTALACTAGLLVHVTAAPLLVKILGITNFDLLGNFGQIEWLGNFRLVLFYNLIFAATTTLCIMNKFTAKVRRELYNRFQAIFEMLLPPADDASVTSKRTERKDSPQRIASTVKEPH